MSAEDNLEMHKLEDIAEEDFTNDSKAEVPNEIDPLIQDTEVEVVTELVSESITGPTIEIITEAIIHSEHAEDIESDDSSEIKETLSPLKDDSTDKLKPILKNTTTLPKVTFESNVGYEDKSPEGQINVENGSQSKSKHFNLPTFVGQEANFEGRPSIPNDYDSLKRKRVRFRLLLYF